MAERVQDLRDCPESGTAVGLRSDKIGGWNIGSRA